MLGSGHIQDMNRRIKENRALNQSRRERRKDQRDAYLSHLSKASKGIDYSGRFTPEEIAAARKAIAREGLKKRKREKVFYTALAIGGLILLISILIVMNW